MKAFTLLNPYVSQFDKAAVNLTAAESSFFRALAVLKL
jgi:hypothetical protein